MRTQSTFHNRPRGRLFFVLVNIAIASAATFVDAATNKALAQIPNAVPVINGQSGNAAQAYSSDRPKSRAATVHFGNGLACGNAEPDPGEECDDGNLADGDGCSSSCQVEDGFECTAAVGAFELSAVGDGGFELGGVGQGLANPFWAEATTSTLFPIDDRPDAAAGDFVAWFGGITDTAGGANNASVAQTVTIPSSASELRYAVSRQVCDPGSLDELRVLIDNNPVASLDCPFGIQFEPYITYTLDLADGPYNDDGDHVLTIEATTRGSDPGGVEGFWTNYFVDEVFIGSGEFSDPVPSVCSRIPESCFRFDFDTETGDLTGFTLFNDGALALDWGTTDDGICWGDNLGGPPAPNLTGGSGEAACIDSDQAGVGLVNAYLCSSRLDFSSATSPEVSLLANYQIFGSPTGEDAFEILTGIVPPSPASIGTYTSVFFTGENVGIFLGEGESIVAPVAPQNGYVCIRYSADFDWYAQVDDLQIQARSCAGTANITGTLRQVAVNYAACREQDVPPALIVPDVGPPSYDCTSAGFTPTPGNTLFTFARGVVNCGGPGCSNVGMDVTGFTPLSATCKNLNTQQSVTIGPLGGVQSIDCSGGGLAANSGETVSIRVRGLAR